MPVDSHDARSTENFIDGLEGEQVKATNQRQVESNPLAYSFFNLRSYIGLNNNFVEGIPLGKA